MQPDPLFTHDLPLSTERRRFLAGALGATALAFLAAQARASEQAKKRNNDPTSCPWCKGDPEKMKAAGIVSHGGFGFGKSNTAKIDEFMSTSDIKWIETDFFRIGFALGEMKVKIGEKKKILAELTRLKKVLPDVHPDTGVLDPWLRIHLYAQRCHDQLARFLDIISGKDAKFSDGSGVWSAGAYRGEGRYLGMKEKFEVMVLRNQAAHVDFLRENFGLQIRMSYRGHDIPRGVMSITCHAEQGQLRDDQALHGHIAFNLAHNFLDGLQHYNYDTPVWFHEGLAHVMERDVDPDFNTFDSGEGAVAEMTSKGNWKPEVLKLVLSGEATRMPELMTIKSYSELKLVHHFTTWSMVDYLLKTKPKELGKFIWDLKNHVDEKKIPTGTNLPEYVRTIFKDDFGMSYGEFDEAWRAWVQINYRAGPPKGGDGPVNPFGPGVPVPGGVPGGGGG